MTFEPLSDHLLRTFAHSPNQHHSSDHFPPTPVPSAPSLPSILLLSDIPSAPLTWLWPARLPLGYLTLLDAAPGCNPSLFALTLAARISSGSPLPDGTPTTQGNVILFAPYDSASTTLKPRLQAAGGDPAHVLLFRPSHSPSSSSSSAPFAEHPVPATTPTHAFSLPRDLPQLAATIRLVDARLLILDPASAIPGLTRCLPALTQLAHQTNCAILLIRSLRTPIANPLHSPAPPSPLLEAVRSRLLLTPAPDNESRCLLLTTHHLLCPQPTILAYDHEAGRKMLIRMKLAGELHSPARGLYTTTHHPSLTAPTNATSPVPNVPTVPTIPIPIPPSSQPPRRADVACPSLHPGCTLSAPCTLPARTLPGGQVIAGNDRE